jgi:hypothetical protein
MWACGFTPSVRDSQIIQDSCFPGGAHGLDVPVVHIEVQNVEFRTPGRPCDYSVSADSLAMKFRM